MRRRGSSLIILWAGLIFMIIITSGCGTSTSAEESADMVLPGSAGDGVQDTEVFENGENEEAVADAMGDVDVAGDKTIEITFSGFIPNTLSIKAGDTVVFVNKDSASHWPASAVHPTHTAYPGSDIKKCNTGEKDIIFDACSELRQGESYSFTFDHAGSWNYHDHLNPSLRGKVIVE